MLRLNYKSKASIVFDLHVDKWDYQGLSWLKGKIGKENIYVKVNATNGKYNFTVNKEILDNIFKDEATVYLLCSDTDKITKVAVYNLQVKTTSINRLPRTITISLDDNFSLKENRHLLLEVEKQDEIDVSSLEPKEDTLITPIKTDRTIFGLSSELEHLYPNVHNNLTVVLDENKIKYSTIENSNDIWVKEFMPLIVGKNRVISYKYDPSYLRRYQNKHLRTDIATVEVNDNSIEIDYHSELTLNGSNYLIIDNNLVMTTQIYGDNCHIEDRGIVDKNLKEDLEVENVIVVPKSKYGTGCINSMIRVIDEDTILVKDFSDESEEFQNRFNESIKLLNKKIITFQYGEYLDYIAINQLIIAPLYSQEKDLDAIAELKVLFPHKTIEGISIVDMPVSSSHSFSSIVATVYI